MGSWTSLVAGLLFLLLMVAFGVAGAAGQSEEAPPISEGELEDATPAEAKEAFTETFEPTLESLALDPPQLEDVERYLDEHTALLDPGNVLPAELTPDLSEAVANAGGDYELAAKAGHELLNPELAGPPPELASSEVPLRAPGADGDPEPIDLTLEPEGDAFAPGNPLVPIELPGGSADALLFGTEQLPITLAGVADSAASRVNDTLFYPSALDDTDIVAAPISTGVELFAQLRSSSSPERLVFEFKLPDGAQLKLEDGIARVARDGEVLAVIQPPIAQDAAGKPVALETDVTDSRLEVVVPHRDKDYAYPILVDPVFESYSWQTTAGEGFAGWGSFKSPGTAPYTLRTTCKTDFLGANCYGSVSPDRGLYSYGNSGGHFAGTTRGGWRYSVPHYPDSSAYVQSALLGPAYFTKYPFDSNSYPALRFGIYMPSAGGFSDWETYTTPQTNLLSGFTPAGSPESSKQVIFELMTNVTTDHTLSSWRDAYLGGATIVITDPDTPQVTASNPFPVAWTKERLDGQFTASASDGGLGVKSMTFLAPGGNQELAPTCLGNQESQCGQQLQRQVSYDTATFPEGFYFSGISVTDPVGHSGGVGPWATAVDRSAPTLSFAGDLAPNATDHSGADRFQLQVDALDGEAHPTDATKWRSGVKSLEVRLEGETVFEDEQPCDLMPGSCSMSFDHTLTTEQQTAYRRYGMQVEVIVTDQVGHKTTQSWIADEGGDQPVVEQLQHDVSPPADPGQRTGLEGWVSDVDVATDAFARDANEAQGIDEAKLFQPVGPTLTDDVPCPNGDCPPYAGTSFSYSTAAYPEGANLAAVRAYRPSGDYSRAKRFHVRVDRTEPVLDDFSFELAGGAGTDLAYDLHVQASDGDPNNLAPSDVRAGVRSIEILVNGKRRFFESQACDEGSCEMERTFRYKPGQETLIDQLNVEAVITDHAGNETREPLVSPPGASVDLSGEPREYGLEDYFHYDSVETGVSTAHANLGTGNVAWHKVPIVNPGRGLSSVLNLTYNTYDYPLSELLPVEDVVPEQPGDQVPALSNILGSLGIGYNQAGPGFSVGISGISRVNEPLGGLTVGSVTSPTSLSVVASPAEITLRDPDGTAHIFKSKLDEPGAYEAPPGVDLRLRVFSVGLEPMQPGEPTIDLPQNASRFWAFTRPDGTTYFYDVLGYARSIVDRNGNEIDFRYELVNPQTFAPCSSTFLPEFGVSAKVVVPLVCEPRLSRVVDATGAGLANPPQSRSLSIAYKTSGTILTNPAFGQIGSVTDHAGRVLRFDYDNAGRLDALTEALGSPVARTTAFEYDMGGALSPLGHPQLSRVTDPRGNATNLGYHVASPLDDIDFEELQNLDLGGLLSAVDLPDRRLATVTNRRSQVRSYENEQDPGLVALGENAARVTDERGVETDFSLDFRERLESISECVEPLIADCDDAGAERRWTGLQWTQDNRVSKLIEGAGSEAELFDSADGAEKAVTSYSYDENGALTGMLDPLNRLTLLDYDDGAGVHTSEFGIDTDEDAFVSDLSQLRRPRGSTWTYEHDERGNVIEVIDPTAASETMTYDSHGQVSEAVDEVGNRTSYTLYDASGQPIEIVAPSGNAVGVPVTHRWLHFYDAAGNLKQVVDPRVVLASPMGGVTSPLPESTPAVASFQYDALDRLTREQIPRLSSSQNPDERFTVRTYAYDPNDNQTSRVDGTGTSFASSYNQMDNLRTEDAPGLTEAGDARTERTVYQYDEAEMLSTITAPEGVATSQSGDFTTEFIVDGVGRRVAATRQARAPDPVEDLITSYGFDRRDNLVGVIDPNRNEAADRGPGLAASAAADPADARRMTYQYDDADQRIAEVEDPGSGNLNLRREYSYDLNGNLIREVGPRAFEAGNQTADFSTLYSYDDRDDLIATTDAAGNRTLYPRYDDGKLAAEVRPRGVESETEGDFTVTYTYNPNGELESRSIPWAEGQPQDREVIYVRDQTGNPNFITDARGDQFINGFTATGELVFTERPSWWQIDWGQSAANPDPGRRYRTTEMEGAVPDFAVPQGGPTINERPGTESGASPEANTTIRPSERPPAPRAGDFGHVDRQELPQDTPRDGIVFFNYDEELRLEGVAEITDEIPIDPFEDPLPDPVLDRLIVYDGQGRIVRKEWSFEPDPHPFGDAERIVHEFAYDQNGNLSRYMDGTSVGTADSLSNPSTFDYDQFNRRIKETAPGSQATNGGAINDEVTEFEYDPNGNLLTRITPIADREFTFAYDGADRLTAETNPADETWSYGYDGAGNLISETSPRTTAAAPDGIRAEMSYDAVDRMTELREAVGTGAEVTTTFGYDANGNQTEIVEPGADSGDSGIDPEPRVTQRTFDGRDLPWKTTIAADSPTERTTITEFDANGNLRRVVTPKGVSGSGEDAEPIVADPGTVAGASAAARHATVGVYDEDNLLVERHLPWDNQAPSEVADSSDPNGVNQVSENNRRYRQVFTYDVRGRLESATAPHQSSDPNVSKTFYEYFENDWVSDVSEPTIVDNDLSNNFKHRRMSLRYDYDHRGNQTLWETKTFRNEDGSDSVARRIERAFYPSGLLKSRKGFFGGSSSPSRQHFYFYNANRSLVRLRDPKPPFNPVGPAVRETVIDRDEAEREVAVNETWTTGRDSRFHYDPEGNLTRRDVDVVSSVPDSGRKYTFTYDALGRETKMRVADDGPAPTTDAEADRVTTTTYYPSGDVETAKKPNGTLEVVRWLADGRMDLRIRRPAGVNKSDPADDPPPETTEYDYDDNGNRTLDERGTHAFNARDQLVLWEPEDGDEDAVSYRLNGSGQLLDKFDADTDDADDADLSYAYRGDPDNGERLKSVVSDPPGSDATEPKVRGTYFYDDFGNVVRIRNQTAGGTGVFPAAGDPPANPCADANWTDNQSSYFCFDEFSRLVTSQAPGDDDPQTQIYDGLDRRDARLVDGGGSREYAYIGTSEQLSREQQPGDVTATYDYNSRGERQGFTRQGSGGGATYRSYSGDANGSVEGIENGDGTFAGTGGYDYDPYGDLVDRQPDNGDDAEEELSNLESENPFRFEGFYYDSGIKSYDMLARQYRPEVGRFLSEDRYADAGADLGLQSDPLTQNRYAFAGGNPVSRIEFDGHIMCAAVCQSGEATSQFGGGRGHIRGEPARPYDEAASVLGAAAQASAAATTSSGSTAPPPPAATPLTIGAAVTQNARTVVDAVAADEVSSEVLNFARGTLEDVRANLACGVELGTTPFECVEREVEETVASVTALPHTCDNASVVQCVTRVGLVAAAAVVTRRAPYVGGPAATGVGALPRVPSALVSGPRNVHVYRAVDEAGTAVYAGISKNLARRAAQHGDRFTALRPVTTSPVTRGEARAIEQALILRNPGYQNRINAISPNRPFYDEAVDYGEAWLRNAGL